MLKEASLTEADSTEAEERKVYALQWLSKYAAEDFRFTLQESVIPEGTKEFSEVQKAALSKLAAYIASQDSLDGQDLHTALHAIKEETAINPRDFFGAIYMATLGKSSGPKAGFLLSVLDKDWLQKRFEEVS